MAGLKGRLLLAALLLVAGGVAAQPPAARGPSLVCKKEIAVLDARSAPPTDVAVDSKGRVYVLYEAEGFLDIYDENGKMLQHRGGETERESDLTNITPLSMWVGRQGRSAMLVSEPRQQIVRAVLLPDKDRLITVPLRGTPETMTGPAALARDLEGRFYVWVQNSNKVYVFDGQGQFSTSLAVPGLRRPTQLAVDSQGQLYCLDSAGLHVYKGSGEVAFEVAGATCMYLTGADRLALAGREWVRRYSPEGRLELDVGGLELVKSYEPIAISINDENQFFVYGRDPIGYQGLIQKLNSRGEPLTDFPQAQRPPAAPDPGTRLDYQGRVRLWDKKGGRWLTLHPGGKQEKSFTFVPESDPKGRMAKPADVVIDGEDTAWIADSGNCRIQSFSLSRGGWQKPFAVGIQGGDKRGIPRSLALGRGVIYCVVYPPRGNGEVVLQGRDRSGRLLSQRSICSAHGDPVVKVACGPNGDVFLYQSRVKTTRGWEDAAALTRFSPSFQKLAEAGGEGLGMSVPEHPDQRLFLKPQEDLIPWGQGLLLPTNGRVYKLGPNLAVEKEYKLQFKRRNSNTQRMEDFGGGYIHKQLLYLSDMGNQCVQRVILP